ncbi:hypothetical protein BP5796_08355 [Coleophoma crateriformis]|uniref:Uncharacterized protein n=1 Tax=Coleophoma crateriformis TaxID=565419 RepID=A0A3D8R7Q4_9HELO|nr:hypothetical protein BP5796_08355 [Coleophoma crateriformis]
MDTGGPHDRALRIKFAAGCNNAAVTVLNYGDGAPMDMINQEAGYRRDKSPCNVSNQMKCRSLSDPPRASIACRKYDTFCTVDRKNGHGSRPGVCRTAVPYLEGSVPSLRSVAVGHAAPGTVVSAKSSIFTSLLLKL